jgi:hypothetical protein
MTNTDTVSIEVDRSTYEKFKEERETSKSEHTPAMDADTFLNTLLDTHKAARRGYYGEQ